MENLKLIGTSHIAAQSIKEIKKTVEEFQPDIIAVELDLERAHSLLKGEKSKVSLAAVKQIGFKGYLFAKIGQVVQQRLGQNVGITPGSDMKAALVLAAKNKLQVALIDQPIKITLSNFSKAFTWREKFRFVKDIFKGIFFKKKMIKEMELDKFDLTKVPEDVLIEKLIKQLHKSYPSIYKTLIEDRNKYMVKKLVKLMKNYPDQKILAVVGAGHLSGMNKLLLKIDVVN